MPVRDMTDIMAKRNCLDEVLVQPEGPSNRAGDPRDQLDVDDPVWMIRSASLE